MSTYGLYKKQKGVALIVALMITVVIGVIAMGLVNIAKKGQFKENAFFSNEISYNNAISGINNAVTFLFFARNADFVMSTSSNPRSQSPIPDTVTVNGKSYSKTEFTGNWFNGSDAQLNDDQYLNYDTTGGVWYRTQNGWDENADCANCVVIRDQQNNVLYTYRIELRDFASFSSVVDDSASNYGYRFFRVTSRGVDPVTNAETIMESNVGILSSRQQ